MGVRLPSVASETIVNTTIVTTLETVIVTTPPLNLPLDFAAVIILGTLLWQVGTGTTSYTLRLRQGAGISGPVISGLSNVTVSSIQVVTASIAYSDVPGAVAGQQYTITLSHTGSTGNGSVSAA